eukprot:10395509-Ditylum_brightwellii.AAC.1
MWEHMYQCEHDTTSSSRLHMIRKLKNGLKNIKTNGLILKVLVYKIQQWCGEQTSLPRIPTDNPGKLLTEAVADQHDLGWDNMMK